MSQMRLLLSLFIAIAIAACGDAASDDNRNLIIVLNPYEAVDWDTFQHHKAALHVHTLQSDGYHMLDEVVRTYHEAGFSILAITDHDIFEPNRQVRSGNVDASSGSHLPLEPRPENYPINTTWPWTDFEAQAPDELGMVGIHASELTSKHHMNAYFASVGVLPGDDVSEDDQLLMVKEAGGIAILDHPGIDAAWWTRRPIEWYIERFETHAVNYLPGFEVTNAPADRITYDLRLWDQLLARSMPDRPIWGFGTDDMHELASVRESDSVFLLDELTEDAVRQAMIAGQFYSRWSSRRFDFRDGRGTFPAIQRIEIDNAAGTMRIEASDYDEIRWISAPESMELVQDYLTSNEPWELGRTVGTGSTLNFREAPGISRYVRIELSRTEGDHTFRTFTNPFGLAVR